MSGAPNGYFPGTRNTPRQARQIIKFRDGDPAPAPLAHPEIPDSSDYSLHEATQLALVHVPIQVPYNAEEHIQRLTDEISQLRELVSNLCNQQVRRSQGMRALARISHAHSRSTASQAMSEGSQVTAMSEDTIFPVVPPQLPANNGLDTTLPNTSEVEPTSVPKEPEVKPPTEAVKPPGTPTKKDTENSQGNKNKETTNPQPKKGGARNWFARKLIRVSTTFLGRRSRS
ncbi:hypothetical protein EDC01DRAFT_633836 [Geopyxis carbonaria]|nr:hypothetical protein EDC01DRAFT_633836 [Geopyxis carbonaria]